MSHEGYEHNVVFAISKFNDNFGHYEKFAASVDVNLTYVRIYFSTKDPLTNDR
jgi:hypothetical protein